MTIDGKTFTDCLIEGPGLMAVMNGGGGRLVVRFCSMLLTVMPGALSTYKGKRHGMRNCCSDWKDGKEFV